MNYLLDTHTLLWWLADEPGLSTKARSVISDPHNMIFVSSASTWEITIKKALGKLIAPSNLGQVITECGFLELPITITHSVAVGNLSTIHDDPFDRIIIAQALTEKLSIVTRDSIIPQYKIPVIQA